MQVNWFINGDRESGCRSHRFIAKRCQPFFRTEMPIDKKTKLKVIRITIFWVVIGYLYIYRGQIVADFRHIMNKEKWETEEPRGNLINGKRDGEWITYFVNGQLAAVENYRNDTLHGRQIHYSPQGFYKLRANYKMGIKVDSFYLYNSNGQVNIIDYRDSTGTPQGQLRTYDTNGQMIQTGQYKDGEFDGEFRTFYRTGQLETIKYFTRGKRIGTWLEFSIDGDTIQIEQY
jgi:hypothetical protein